MIIKVGGKRLAFGLQWKPHLSGGDLHKEARAAKAPYFWTADNSAYYGLLNELDSKKRVRSPVYAGAIVLLHRYTDVPNFVVVLSVSDNGAESTRDGFIVCGIHHSRPHSDFDKVVGTKEEVTAQLKAFQHLCGPESFKIFGDVRISGIESVSREQALGAIDQGTALRKTKNALFNPLVGLLVAGALAGTTMYGYNAYKAHKRAEARRLAAASQKNAQQLYEEELALRRKDGVVLARDIEHALAVVVGSDFNLGGWAIEKVTCNPMAEKQVACTFEYKLRQGSKGTYETFVAAAKELENVEFAGDRVNGTRVVKAIPFVEQGAAIDVAKPQREAIIEFASGLQRLRHLGEPKLNALEAFAIPAGTSVSGLTSPPITTATWEFVSPLRNAKFLAAFPAYATLTQLVVLFGDTPRYEGKQSIAMLTVHGRIFSKPTLPGKQ